MLNQETLLELTESYLKSLIAEVSASSLGTDFDSSTPFGELGIDSFRVLKIIKALEADFGTLPKALLFENFHVEALAQYFIGKYPNILDAKFSSGTVLSSAMSAAASSKPVVSLLQKTPIRLLEKDLRKYPELEALVNNLSERYKNEGGVSRGTRNIAPNLFIGSEKKGYVNYSRSHDIILIYAYTGPEEYFPEIVKEVYRYCIEKKFQLNAFFGETLDAVDGVPFTATPFGALQRVLNIQDMALDGSAMRRLRYQVSKFEKAGAGKGCRTQEYQCGTDSKVDRDIADVIDRWCANKPMVNPLIHIVKEEILAGALHAQHRIFLTYLDDALQNVILISEMCSALNGYLMDLEFYGKDMPMGGLEYAIVQIIKTLAAEGRTMLSMGGTYGCRLEHCAKADPEIDKILDELHKQHIFNDEGNLQFKNKFRPENRTIYLCRPVAGAAGSGKADNVIDIIMMIADPAKMQTSDEENHHAVVAGVLPVNSGNGSGSEENNNARLRILTDFGFNPLNIPPELVEFDLKTDSWAQLHMQVIEHRMQHLRAQLPQPADLQKSLREIFPFAHFVLTDSGRTAEGIFYKAWANKGVVLQNLLFPTTIFHQLDKGFIPKEIPRQEVFQLDSKELFKGELDWASLQEQLRQDPAAIAMVCIEVNDNAAGGYPVSLAHLKKVKSLLAGHAIPLVIDGTRVIENARFLIENEEACAGQTVWEAMQEILRCADAVIISLAKDFCVKGGLVATNDELLFRKLQDLAREEGCGLDAIDKKLVALGLQQKQFIDTHTLRRKEAVKQIWTAFKQHGIPVVEPAGGHCVLIDVKRIPEFKGLKYPVASFTAWMYLNAGIRVGEHNAGMQQNTPINNLVRMAIPVGLKQEQIDRIIGRCVALFADIKNIPDIQSQSQPQSRPSIAEDTRAHPMRRSHRNSLLPERASDMSDMSDIIEDNVAKYGILENRFLPSKVIAESSPKKIDIAIVGMAGRYPKAKNVYEMWENLVQGKDCIDTISDARLAQRLQNKFSRKYKGGFIDDVDKFDAGFFNIPAKEAEILDPQERLFLETAYEAIEDAGYYPEILVKDGSPRNIGVYVGAVWSTYQMIGVEEKIAGNNINPSSFFWSIANRVSYWMNLSGPSMTLDTACSSSLTAVKLACDAIERGECCAAIAGGVNLDLHQSKLDINSMGGSLSQDGVCRSFGKGANGYVSGEGVGALFLKPLERALADGDHVYGVIKSAVVTHSGKTSGYTIPSPNAQMELIVKALEKAEIDARSIGYIEAHGTGTELGDSIEISGLTRAFQKHNTDKHVCPIGSIKTNIGHLEAASGIVGIQKILLQMKFGKLVPSLHAAQTNENIDFENSPFYVQQTVEEWRAKEVDGARFPRRAGISAMGAGGTNAHIVIEEYEEARNEDGEDGEYGEGNAGQFTEKVFPLSAKSAEQLMDAAIRLRNFLRKDLFASDFHERQRDSQGQDEHDISHTLRIGRKSFDYRLTIIAKSRKELVERLTFFIEGIRSDDIMVGHTRKAEVITGLLNSKEKQDFINLLVQSRDPRRLARLWSDGVILDWQGVEIGQGGRTGKRMSLPGYVFANERYWIAHRKLLEVELPAVELPAVDLPKVEAVQEGDIHIVPSMNLEAYRFTVGSEHGRLQGRHAGVRLENLSIEDKSRLLVRQMVAHQLHISIDAIDQDCQLMDTGITSMDMARMTQEIKERFDPAFSPTAFFECTTLRSFAGLLAQKYPAVFQTMVVTRLSSGEEGKKPSAEKPGMPAKPLHVQDAESDLMFLDLKTDLKTISKTSLKTSTHCILLTGATGFLGIHLLSEMLNADPKMKVFCLVRASDKEQGLQRILKQAEKFELEFDKTGISVLCGNINAPKLGLTEDEWKTCCTKVEQIVHASARVNHIEGYATFRDSTLGMKEIIRMAGTHRLKLVQFISSTAGCARKIGAEFSIYEHEDFVEDGEHVYGGYGQSKWVQETFLKRAHQYGIPYVIYRFGELSGSSRTGLGQIDDMLHRLLQMRLGVECREKIANDVLDMLPVDFAAKMIAATGKTPALWNRIVHATHLKPYGFAHVYRQAQEKGLQFKPVTREHYLSTCYDFIRYIYSINPVNGFVLECVMRDVEGSMKNRKMMDGYFAIIFPFEQENFKQAIKILGLSLPEWPALMECYLNRWSREDCGFMSRIFGYRKWSQLDEKQKTALMAEKVAEVKKTAEIYPDEQSGHDVLEIFLEGER